MNGTELTAVQAEQIGAIVTGILPFAFVIWVVFKPASAMLVFGLVFMLGGAALGWNMPMIALAGPMVLFVGGALLAGIGGGLGVILDRLDDDGGVKRHDRTDDYA